MARINILVYPTVEGTNFCATNLMEASPEDMVAPQNIIEKRRGKSFKNIKGNFWMPARYSADSFKQLLNALNFDADVIEPNSIENKTAKSMQMVSMGLNYRNSKVGFGKYKDICWKDVPDDYLEWVCENMKDGVNKQYAIKERGFRKG